MAKAALRASALRLDGTQRTMQDPTVRYEISTSEHAVQMWTERRLPFEPKGEALRARDELRAALKALSRSSALTAEYTSDGLGLCDVENVLHYNVGPSAMSHLCAQELSVERLFTAPILAPTNARYRHHVRYRRGTHERVAWTDGPLIARRCFAVPANEPLDVANVWFHARRAAPTPWTGTTASGFLSAVVEIRVPAARRIHAGASLKTIVDAIVSSLHRHDGSDIAALAQRLSARIEAAHTAVDLEALLLEGAAELGERRLLWLRSDGVQWNPADDGFTALVARVADGATNMIEIDARVFNAVRKA